MNLTLSRSTWLRLRILRAGDRQFVDFLEIVSDGLYSRESVLLSVVVWWDAKLIVRAAVVGK